MASYLIVAVPGWLGLLTQMFSTEVQGEMDIDAADRAELGPAGVSQSGRAVSSPGLCSHTERERERERERTCDLWPVPRPSTTTTTTIIIYV